MSKQKNGRFYGKSYGKKQPHQIAGDMSPRNLDSNLSTTGLAVFRSLEEQDPLFEIQNKFKSMCGHMTYIARGELGSFPMALSQLMLHEVMQNKNIFTDVNAKEAVDHIYDNVKSLRRQTVVKLGSLGLFGARNNSMAIVGIAVHKDEMERINTERRQIIDAIEDITAPPDDYEFQWLQRQIPHITFGKIEAKHVNAYKQEIRPILAQEMPDEIQLKRATIYKPNGL
jgi:nucleoid DNA-binding protein